MTFGGEVKNELCRGELHRRCCAQAEAYGVLMYCNTFSGSEIRIVTEHEAFAQHSPLASLRACLAYHHHDAWLTQLSRDHRVAKALAAAPQALTAYGTHLCA